MIFHENRLLADDSHIISYLIFVEKLGKMSQHLSSAAVVIGALRAKFLLLCVLLKCLCSNFEGSQRSSLIWVHTVGGMLKLV